MEKTDVDLLVIIEIKWIEMGHFTSDEHEFYYFGQDTLKCNRVAFICNNKLRRCVMGFDPVNDRIATIRIQCKSINIPVVQVYAPTSISEEEDIEDCYETVQYVINQTSSGDSLYIIGDWNAKVGKDISNGITGNFGMGERKGYQLVELCSRNNLRIMNTLFKLHPRRLYTWRSPEKITRNQIDLFYARLDGKSV